jgi:hypothetical protein
VVVVQLRVWRRQSLHLRLHVAGRAEAVGCVVILVGRHVVDRVGHDVVLVGRHVVDRVVVLIELGLVVVVEVVDSRLAADLVDLQSADRGLGRRRPRRGGARAAQHLVVARLDETAGVEREHDDGAVARVERDAHEPPGARACAEFGGRRDVAVLDVRPRGLDAVDAQGQAAYAVAQGHSAGPSPAVSSMGRAMSMSVLCMRSAGR